MKRHLFSGLFLLFSFGMGAYASQEKYVSFNDNWLFTLSDSHDYSLTTYNPEGWRQLDLPHDWTIEKPFDKNLEGCTAFTPGGIGWYSKIFKTEISENQKCYIIFDGVYNNADFWINGMRLGNHPYGYAPIWYDLTDFIEPENGINRLSVRVDHSRYADSRWYTVSGIYRNVKMLITDKLHIPVWGTFITTPVINKESASVNIRVDVENDYSEAKSGRVYTDIYDADNKKVATVSTAFNLASGEKVTLNQDVELFDPKLWDIDSPYLYIAKTYIVSGNETIGNRETRFGVRTIHFDKDKGFFLNGKNMKVKGVCLHHDAGIVGTAVPKDVWKRRLAILKAGGCNAIRTAHNPASDEFLDLCDEMGFLVQNEFYDEWDLPKDKRYNMHDKEVDYITRGHSEHFQQWAEIDLKNVMRSSRNHPCIFQWSIGNEIEWTYPGNRSATGLFGNTDRNDKMDWTLWRTPVPPNSPEVVREFWRNYPRQTFSIGKTAAKLAKWSREMDTTRYVIANLILPTSSFETGYTDVLDIAGFSYKPAQYDYLREKYPNKIMMGTENVPRWYEWKACIERDYIAGVFLWTGVDYLGERRAQQWPQKATPEGPLDLAGFPRGSYYQFKSFWTDEPVIAIYTQTAKLSIFKKDADGNVVEKKKDYWKLAPRVWQNVNPHWNYSEGEKIIVEIYSNCDEIELFQNGKSLGKQSLKDQEDRIFKWATDYSKGKLTAVGTYKGKKVKETLETVDEAYSIKLVPDRKMMTANNTDVLHVVAQLVDKKGREVKNVDDEIKFTISGDYRFLGTDCGKTEKMDSFKKKMVKTEFGRCLLMIQSTKTPSDITITATNESGSLKSKPLVIPVKEFN